MFLQTECGDLIAAKSIVRIGPLNTRSHISRRWHEVDYCVGREPRTTTAGAQAVEDFLNEV